MKKILLIAESTKIINENYQLYLKYLNENKCHITIATYDNENIKYCHKKILLRRKKTIKTLRKLVKENNFDIIYTTDNILFRIFAKNKTSKNITIISNFNFIKEYLLRSFSDIYIALNEIEYKIIKEKIKKNTFLVNGYGIVEEKINLSNNYKIKIKNEIGIGNNDFVLLTQDKDNYNLIEYMNEVKEDVKNIKLIINNKINDREKELIKFYRLEDNIKIIETNKLGNKIYLISDLYISTNKKISFDKNIAKAMNFNLPIIAFKNNANTKMIKKNGYLVEDKISFIDRIESIYYEENIEKIKPDKKQVKKYLFTNIIKSINEIEKTSIN